MINKLQEALWRQFGASIDMLINVISECPADYLAANKRFYYLAYHAVLFLDYYLSIPPQDFSPILTFTIKEKDQRPPEAVGDLIPDKIYSQEELIGYLKHSRDKCKSVIASLVDDDRLQVRFTEGDQAGDMNYSILEILLYNLRHTQHHTGQLNMLVRQDLDRHMEWVFRADDPDGDA